MDRCAIAGCGRKGYNFPLCLFGFWVLLCGDCHVYAHKFNGDCDTWVQLVNKWGPMPKRKAAPGNKREVESK